MKIIVTLMASMFLMVGVAQAAPYGSAGCGVGSIIFGDKEGIVQVLAVTTNGISANQTFGITSGTLNCGAAASDSAKVTQFIETNREALAKDIARGEGETINSIAKLAGCQDTAKVGGELKANFKSIFPTAKTSNQDVSKSVINTMKSKTLMCGNLG
jgi:hypothetical protein